MPWKTRSLLEARQCFVQAALHGLRSVAQLCGDFGISQKTGFKWLQRFRELGGPGLRGLPDDAQQTWEWVHINYDHTPPVLTITNPVTTSGSMPMIQLQGYCPEPLASLRFDVTNATGLLPDQQGLVLSQSYDTNVHAFTTNFFQCFDLDLTNGLNTVTLRATDLAGNASVTTFNYTLNSDTTAPVISLGWPQDGMTLCGDTLTVDGWVDDPSAAITVNLVDATGATNLFSGIVERDGRFWVESLPLGAGTNALTLTATDAWTNSATTNFTVIKSALGLAVNPIDPNQLFQSSISVTGTVSGTGYTVWVNGVQATVPGSGTWRAEGVPVNAGGMASFTVAAYAPGHDLEPGSANLTKTNADKRDLLYVERDIQERTYNWHERDDWYWDPAWAAYDWAEQWHAEWSGHRWTNSFGGRGWWWRNEIGHVMGAPDSGNLCDCHISWAASDWPDLAAGNWSWNSACAEPRLPEGPTPIAGMEYCRVDDPTNSRSGPYLIPAEFRYKKVSREEDYRRKAQTILKLFTGGKAIPHGQSLFVITGAVWQVTNNRAVPPFNKALLPSVPPANVVIGELGALGSDGNRYAGLPDGVTKDVTPRVPGKSFYAFKLDHQKYKLTISANGIPLDSEAVVPQAQFLVGQLITFSHAFNPTLPSQTQRGPVNWYPTGHFLNAGTNTVPGFPFPLCSTNFFVDQKLLTNLTTTAWWVSGGFNQPEVYEMFLIEALTLPPDGQIAAVSAQGLFHMYRPQGSITCKTSYVALDDAYSPSQYNLHYGITFAEPGQVGILISNNVTMPSGYSYATNLTNPDTQAVQVIYSTLTRYQTNALPYDWYRLEAADVLDSRYPYGFQPELGYGPTCTSDSPHSQSLQGYQAVSVSSSFGFWLEFRPPGGRWVPLRRLDWSWGGAGLFTNSSWAPNGALTNSIDPTDTETEEYARWTNNIGNTNIFHLRKE